MREENVATRTIELTLTEDERSLLGVLIENARLMADDVRMSTIPGSDRETNAALYQGKVEGLQAKYREALNGSVDV